MLHVEVARLDRVPLPTDQAWLHASEAARLVGLKAPARRAQYLAGHWLARRLLAAVYGGDPCDWHLRERRDRPPQVIEPVAGQTPCSAAVALGLAHSGDWLAAAVGRQRFGIDLEQHGRTLSRATFAPLLVNSDEAADSLDDEALLLRWVVKEAWIKRDEGSALPARLRALALHSDAAGEVLTYRHPELLLAIAGPHRARFHGATLPVMTGRWRVTDSP